MKNTTLRTSFYLSIAGATLATALILPVLPSRSLAATSPAVTRNQDETPFRIHFDYSKVDASLFTDDVKRQVESGARLIETFIGDKGEMTIVVVNGDTAGAYASGAPSEYETNTDEKTKVSAGGIRFGTRFVEQARDGKGDISALTMHEILHCMGFTEQSKAIAKHLKGGMYSGPHVLALTGDKPVPFDGAHFSRGFKDPNGVMPRMSDGGGNTMSILDLAVLADLGYDIPQIKSGKAVNFHFPESYYSTMQWRDGKKYRAVTGEAGNDVLTGYDYERDGKKGGYILVGGGGNDVLIAGPGDNIMDGENAIFRPVTGKPGNNTFVIPAETGKNTIMGYRPGKDTIYLSPELGVSQEELEKAIKESKQETVGNEGSYIPGNWVIKTEHLELIVSTGSETTKPSLSDFKIAEWKAK